MDLLGSPIREGLEAFRRTRPKGVVLHYKDAITRSRSPLRHMLLKGSAMATEQVIDKHLWHRKYQFMETSMQRKAAGLREKIPDIQKTLDTVRFLKTRTVRLH